MCKTDELPLGERKIVTIGSRSIGVFNLKGEYFAMLNICPHQGAPLCEGPICGTNLTVDEYRYEYAHEDELVRCSRHGWEFHIRDGTAFEDPKIKAKTYPVSVEDGQVVVHV
ncbi:MAG: Rieske (2Fe-2S) protein [Proteobacteria bacterium]|nr:Rieske (2Fe-2S) protein [Pseudomonadota bacterium]